MMNNEILKVTGANGTVYEIKVMEDPYIEYREEGTEEWNEAVWSIFCNSNGIELDALA